MTDAQPITDRGAQRPPELEPGFQVWLRVPVGFEEAETPEEALEVAAERLVSIGTECGWRFVERVERVDDQPAEEAR